MSNLNDQQFIRVYHASRSKIPPHRQLDWDSEHTMQNVHPDVIHAGTEEAAFDVASGIGGSSSSLRNYVHVYDIPVSKQYGVVFGDDFSATFTPEMEERSINYPNQWNDPSPRKLNERLKGQQVGLFESMIGTADIPIRSKMAVPYRNRAEDIGSISWMIPKNAFEKGGVRHVGVIPYDRLRNPNREKTIAYHESMKKMFGASDKEYNEFMKEERGEF